MSTRKNVTAATRSIPYPLRVGEARFGNMTVVEVVAQGPTKNETLYRVKCQRCGTEKLVSHKKMAERHKASSQTCLAPGCKAKLQRKQAEQRVKRMGNPVCFSSSGKPAPMSLIARAILLSFSDTKHLVGGNG